MEKIEQYLEHILKYGIFACLFIPLVVTSFTLFPFVFGKATLFAILTEILFAGFVLLVLLNRAHLPRPSPLLLALGIWFGVLVLSTVFSINPMRSFWSTIERREGLLLFTHLILFFIVLIGIFRKKEDWTQLFQVSIFVSILVSLYTLLQLFPVDIPFVSATRNISRPGGPLGNPVFLGSYLLFHVFLSFLFFFNSEDSRRKIIYGSIAGFQLVISLLLVSARAASLGILGGIFIFTGLWILYEAKPKIKMAFAASVILLLVIVGSLFVGATSGALEKSYFADRFFNLKRSFDAPGATGKQRIIEWEAALKGIGDRPLFGWGLDNFSALYDRHFPPEHPYYFAAEHRVGVDRAHSLYFDWASATGMAGLVSFLVLLGVSVWMLFRGLKKNTISRILVYVLSGLFGAYLIQGIFTFDTINTYIPLFLIIGFVHFLTTSPRSLPAEHRINATKQGFVALILTFVVLLAVLIPVMYVVNIKPTQAVIFAREGFLARARGDVDGSLGWFNKSFSLDTFASHEVRLNFANGLNPRNKEEFEKSFSVAQAQLKETVLRNPHEVRYYLGLGRLYNKQGALFDPASLTDAEEILSAGLEISPTRGELLYEIGATQMFKKDFEQAEEFFRRARDLDPRFPKAWWFLGISQIAQGDLESAKNTLDTAAVLAAGYPPLGGFSRMPEAFWVSLVYRRIGYLPGSLQYFEKLTQLYSNEDTYYLVLAGLYAGEGIYDKAGEAARVAAEINPELEEEIEQFLIQLEKLKEPQN